MPVRYTLVAQWITDPETAEQTMRELAPYNILFAAEGREAPGVEQAMKAEGIPEDEWSGLVRVVVTAPRLQVDSEDSDALIEELRRRA